MSDSWSSTACRFHTSAFVLKGIDVIFRKWQCESMSPWCHWSLKWCLMIEMAVEILHWLWSEASHYSGKCRNTEVLQSLFDGAGLTRLRAVSGTKNCCSVLMARPTQVSPWLHDDWLQQCHPKMPECGVGNRIDTFHLFSYTLVCFPYASLLCARRKELDMPFCST